MWLGQPEHGVWEHRILLTVLIVILYIIGAEMAKKTFYKKVKF
ncbi:MAG: hypothetical protein ACREIQ_06895 [Nitrospiria bacterium]